MPDRAGQRLVADAGYAAASAGRLFLLMGACSLLCGVLWGGLSDRIGRRSTLVLLYLVRLLQNPFTAHHRFALHSEIHRDSRVWRARLCRAAV
jgi:MFS family permease